MDTTKNKLNILAGIIACSNMGFGRPFVDEVARIKYSRDIYTAHDAVLYFCGNMAESEEHEQIFCDEADMWAEVLSKQTPEQIKNNHPDIVQLYDEA